MASLIPGYEYDIFISYRQKDNKGDKWVSKFVDALKTELEATFKEDISVYFDENPHDRLQETHNVDKSLENKLKCLIFIPILSQTYCDPNSYAWQYEFLAFLRMAENDHSGKDVRLRSGNVASRILPIRIHDLEQEDVKLFEKETGGMLRAMDFVFKTSTGVVRPLIPNEVHPNDNLNKTFYRDQICKAALAVKEIILGMKKEPVVAQKEKDPVKEVRGEEGILIPNNPPKQGKRKLIPIFTIAALLAIIVFIVLFAYPKIFKRDTLEKLRSSGARISVIVMPFQNNSNDSLLDVWQEGIQEILINSLSNSEDLKVQQTNLITSYLKSKGFANYASITSSVASTISKKLDASVLIFGGIKQEGLIIRLNAQLIDSKSEEVIKSFQIEGPSDKIIYTTDTLSKMIRNYLIISKLGKGESPLILSSFPPSTNSPDALRYYLYGSKAYATGDLITAKNWLFKSYENDSTFFLPAYLLSATFWGLGMIDQSKYWCLKIYKKREALNIIDQLRINFMYSKCFGTDFEAIQYLTQLTEIDKNDVIDLHLLGLNYSYLFQYNKAIPVLEKALEIYDEWDSKPFWDLSYTLLGEAYHKTGQYKKEKKLYEKAIQDFPDNPGIIYRQSVLFLTLKDTIAANHNINRFISLLKDLSASEATIDANLASIYSEAGVQDKSEQYHRRALSIEPKRAFRLNNLAWFLIDKDRNINEGLELVERALKLSPENYNYLDTKGWGLYKQGKYEEALEILQKSWNLRREKAVYNHEAFLHLEASKKAVAGLKNN
jgi:tetratricopeptide (TPR) repeat protein/TolB-like protein